MSSKPKPIIVVAGPTASGKSSIAIQLAKQFSGEIISADSRQVYRGLDIGTGKISKKEQALARHHLLDVASPKHQYSVARFIQDLRTLLPQIRKRGHIPIICGGTHFWIDAFIYSIPIPKIAASKPLRKILSRYTLDQLVALLTVLDARRVKSIDKKNPRRVIRALEISIQSGKPVDLISAHHSSSYDVCYLAVSIPSSELKKRIVARLHARLRGGMIAEAKRLHMQGVSFRRMNDLGLEYRRLSQFLQKKITKKQLVELLSHDIWNYAKRQNTWLKKNPHVLWIRTHAEAKRMVKKFLQKEPSHL